MTIIGLIGNKYVGKDTIADHFVKNGFKKISFACLFNYDDEQLNN